MKKWIKSPWTVSLGTALFSLLGTVLYDYFKEKPILTTINQGVNWLVERFTNFINLEIKLWLILVILAALVLIFILYILIENKKVRKPEFLNYKEDRLKKWRWSWEWKWSETRKAWIISNLEPHCPNCGTTLMEDSNALMFHGFGCPRCDFYAGTEKFEDPRKIEALILDNLNRKESNLG